MLVTRDTTDGQERYYLTRASSVVCFFTDDGDGGIAVHVEPGVFACPYSTTPEKLATVRDCCIDEVARRLGCTVEDVFTRHRFHDLAPIADRPVDPDLFWFGRGRARSKRR